MTDDRTVTVPVSLLADVVTVLRAVTTTSPPIPAGTMTDLIVRLVQVAGATDAVAGDEV